MHAKPNLLLAVAGLLLLAGLGGSAPCAAQEAPPTLQPDEKDFEGLTSLSLGSGARALGMGGAFLARADDATAASWNPAGISYLRRPEVSVVGARNAFWKRPQGGGSDHLVGYTPDFAAVAVPFDSRDLSGALQLSYLRVLSFSGNRTIRSEATGSFFETEGSGGFDVVAFGAGLKFGRSVRVGLTCNRWGNGYTQSREKRTGIRVQLQDIEYRLSGWNINLGLIVTPVDGLNFGAVAKTPFTGRVTLTRDRTTFSEFDLQGTQNSWRDDDVKIDFPGAAGVGVSWRARSSLTFSADYTRTFWSDGRIHNFFTIDPRVPGQDTPPPRYYGTLPYPTLDDEVQVDTEQFRFGAEYVVIARRLKMPLRVGYFSDRQYFQSATGQAPTFHGLTAGLGFLIGPFLLDAAFIGERGTYQDAEAQGRAATTTTQRFFVSLIYRHGSTN